MSYAIEIIDVKKNYGKHAVLKGISLHVAHGEIFGILGVNGAGKTTLLECIEGFRSYSSGTIKISGTIGLQLQASSLPPYIKVGEAISLFAKAKHVKIDPFLLNDLGIHDLQKKLYSKLSAGQKRRLHLALALLDKPDILFLDGPTTELDVEGRIALHNEIQRLNKQGTTVILSSHDMAEVEALCNRIAILNNGIISFLGTTDELASKVGKSYTIKIISKLGEEEYSAVSVADSLLRILEEYKQKHIPIYDIKVHRGTLEQHFINLSKEAGK